MGRLLKRVAGFTFFEMVLTIAVLAVLVVGAYVAIDSSLTSFRLDAASAKLVNDIRFAQHLARTRSDWYGIEFNANPINQYEVFQTDGATDTPVPDPVNPSQNLFVTMSDEYQGVIIEGVNIEGGTRLVFNSLGVPYPSALGAQLVVAGSITLSQGVTSRIIQIIPETGRVEEQ